MIQINSLFRKLDISYARHKARSFKSFINSGDRVLDLGSGRGFLAEAVRNITGANVTCVDIDDHNKTSLPHFIYDGSNLPFSDNSFDVVLLIFVLHHTDEQIKVLDEAKRVTKDNGYIIVLEDSYINKLQYMITMLTDYLLNAPKGIRTPFNFKKESEWRSVFGSLNLELKSSKVVNLGFLDFVRHPLFILKK